MITLLARVANHWDNRLSWRLGRALCHRFRMHTLGCRGRQDHTAASGAIVDPERWLP